MRIPQNCVSCPHEMSCNTALNLPDCRYYYIRNEKISIVDQLKNLFGKFFK